MSTADDIAVTELSIASDAITLSAKTWGDPCKPAVLALHGWLDNAGSFDRLAPLLAGDHHVVALDLRGHGRSGHLPPGSWYHYVDYFDDISAVFVQLGWQRASLLGHSLGGTLACLYAALYPDRCAALWTVEALGPLTGTTEETLPRLKAALEQRALNDARRPLRVFGRIDEAVEVRMRANHLSRAAARAIVDRGIDAVDGGYVWSSDPRLTLSSAQRFSEAGVLGMLAGIRAPTLAILAEPATGYLSAALMAARSDAIAGIRVLRIEGNHHLHLERAADVAAAIRSFSNADQAAGV